MDLYTIATTVPPTTADPFRQTFEAFLIVAGAFVAVANIGLVFFFISKIHSNTKQNALDITRVEAAHAEKMAKLEVEIESVKEKTVEHSLKLAVIEGVA